VWQYKVYADIRGGSLGSGRQMSVVVENGDFRFFRSLSSEHFTYIHTTGFQMIRLSMTLATFQGH